MDRAGAAPERDEIEGASPPAGADATPMMAQYLAIKDANPGYLLFYRMGDFYEMFFEDAVRAAEALDITLTRRGRHGDADIPMAGVPVKSHEAYLERLIRKGFKVAICEQTEDPEEARRRGSKSLVRREVVRLVTPGTLTEETLLDARAHNFLAALADAGGGLALAWLDMSTGEFLTQPIEPAAVESALARLAPGELLLPERLLARPDLARGLADRRAILTELPDPRFDSEGAQRRLMRLFGPGGLDDAFARAEHAACGAIVDYVELTQQGRLPRLAPPRRLIDAETLEIDPATRRNLELAETLAGERRGSLLATVDRTVTGAGARLLAARLAAPLTDPTAIARRLDAVDRLATDTALRADLRRALRRAPDMARALSRLTLGRGGPRDLVQIRDGLGRAGEIRALVEGAGGDALAGPLPEEMAEAAADIGDHATLVDLLARALAAEPPLLARDGGAIARGHSAELDELRALRDDSRRLVAELQARYAAETGVSSLKLRHNNVLGYFVEVTQTHADKLAGDARFIHRQTMANAMRFTTVELSDLEARISRAADSALALEVRLVDALIAAVTAEAEPIARAAAALARLDVAAALADLAVERAWTRPVVDSSLAFRIEGGRHPVVEAALLADGGGFVANDCDIGAEPGGKPLWLVTGPNMAGKSTFLRQNALIAILAQLGSFVPARAAHIGAVDRLFSRVGAADDLARGRSTFMVEMVETAAILNRAGPRSLVILDEIGRGTATFDGLSIAWATVEHLHEVNRCRGLFATHYHELTLLAEKLAGLALHTMRVKEWRGDVVFLHEVAPGAADRSYGIHVARLAGLPASVVRRAEAVLKRLQAGGAGSRVATLVDDLPLFAATAAAPPEAATASPALDRLEAIEPDTLTPKAALDLIYELKRLMREGGS